MTQRERITHVTERDINALTLQEVGLRGHLKYNCFTWTNHFESDVILHQHDGSLIEFEFKNNYADYRLDFTKCIGRMKRKDGVPPKDSRRTRKPGDTRTFKHDMIKDGKTGLEKFFFACPTGVIKKEMIPEYAGLVYVDQDLFGRAFLEIIKEAPTLPHVRRDQPLFVL